MELSVDALFSRFSEAYLQGIFSRDGVPGIIAETVVIATGCLIVESRWNEECIT